MNISHIKSLSDLNETFTERLKLQSIQEQLVNDQLLQS